MPRLRSRAAAGELVRGRVFSNISERYRRAALYAHHKFDHEFPATPVKLSYMVCSLPRSGSSVLCDVLAATGLAGAPTEYFEETQMPIFSEIWGTTTLDEYLDALVAKKTSPNGVFGIKALYDQFETVLGRRLPRSIFPNLRYVYVKRRDRIRQAVSLSRALQTEQWASVQPRGKEASYNPAQIREALGWIERDERSWERFFEEEGVSPLRLEYETFIPHLDEVVAHVLAFLGIPVPDSFSPPRPSLAKQADQLSEEWVRRYQEASVAGGTDS